MFTPYYETNDIIDGLIDTIHSMNIDVMTTKNGDPYIHATSDNLKWIARFGKFKSGDSHYQYLHINCMIKDRHYGMPIYLEFGSSFNINTNRMISLLENNINDILPESFYDIKSSLYGPTISYLHATKGRYDSPDAPTYGDAIHSIRLGSAFYGNGMIKYKFDPIAIFNSGMLWPNECRIIP